MTVKRGEDRHFVLSVLAPLALAAAGVQAAPPTPGSVNDSLKPATPLQAPEAIGVPKAPAAPTAAPAAGPQITVRSFALSGNTVFAGTELLPLLNGYLNRPLSIAQLYEAADVVAAFYQRHGYTLTSVTLPPQSVDNGAVRLQIVEGRVGQVQFEGRGYSADSLQAYAHETRAGDIYQSAHLEDDLQNLNALPGLASRAVLQPGKNFGTSDVIVKSEFDPIDVIAEVDNYGRKDVGEYRYSLGATVNNLVGIADRLQLFGVHSNTGRLNYGYGAYGFALNHRGLRFNVDYGFAKFEVAPPFEVTGINRNLDAGFEQAFVRSSRNTLLGTAGYTHTSADADLSGVPISKTKLDLGTFGLTYAHRWSDGAVSQLLGSLHSNFREGSATRRNRERARLELDAQQLQPLFARFELLLHLDGVYSPDPLADTEQISIGGPTSIRGFPPSEVRGDRGYFVQATLRRAFGIGPVVFVPRGFVDTGLISRLQVPPGTPKRDSLTSAGAGIDIVYRTFSAKVDWSYPLDSKPVSDGRNDGRAYAAITAGF